MAPKKKGGWFRESRRHSLASRGVKTGAKGKPKTPRVKRASSAKPPTNVVDTLWGYLTPFMKELNKKDKERVRAMMFNFEGLPPQVALDLARADPKLMDLHDVQNMSPEMGEMIEYAMKNGGTLGGYVIPPESGRDDARVSITDFTLPIGELQALRLQNDLRADEFSKEKGGYRFWWD